MPTNLSAARDHLSALGTIVNNLHQFCGHLSSDVVRYVESAREHIAGALTAVTDDVAAAQAFLPQGGYNSAPQMTFQPQQQPVTFQAPSYAPPAYAPPQAAPQQPQHVQPLQPPPGAMPGYPNPVPAQPASQPAAQPLTTQQLQQAMAQLGIRQG